MGIPSPAVSGHPRMSSMIFSAATAAVTLVSFAVPPTMSVVSALDMLIEGMKEIAGITQKSNRRDLVEFGEYVAKVVNKVVSALGNDQLAQQTGVRESLENLQTVLASILIQISRNNSGGLWSRIWRLVFAEEIRVDRMRKQFNDALDLFQFDAALKLVLRVPNLSPSDIAVSPGSEAKRSQTFESFLTSNASARNHHHEQRRQAIQVAEPLPYAPRIFPQLARQSQTYTARARPRIAPIATGFSSPQINDIAAAFMDVESCRRSIRHARSPMKNMQLANALGHLSVLLSKTGRTREALEASQECAELYKTLAEGGH
ncbi:unnamed protein product [Rhizoctonia solani]|uniref:Fungal N-terminal domain-containing protein n=1 Tax=Rhizoctonia solani TaxID=456999 RepID=A0A8H2ZZD9_9AGAM|nr:unnamed protein product [Rhizoctonia solani]